MPGAAHHFSPSWPQLTSTGAKVRVEAGPLRGREVGRVDVGSPVPRPDAAAKLKRSRAGMGARCHPAAGRGLPLGAGVAAGEDPFQDTLQGGEGVAGVPPLTKTPLSAPFWPGTTWETSPIPPIRSRDASSLFLPLGHPEPACPSLKEGEVEQHLGRGGSMLPAGLAYCPSEGVPSVTSAPEVGGEAKPSFKGELRHTHTPSMAGRSLAGKLLPIKPERLQLNS